MDYPAPLVKITDGSLDFSETYTVGIGAWDKHTIRYAYSQWAPSINEVDVLEAIVQDGLKAGLHFMSDADARSASAANPRANLWDNGATAEQGLEQILQVRAIAMRHFAEDRIASGQPLALLGEVYAPVYFMHRYAVEAAAKVLGGYDYTYALRGDGQKPMTPMPRNRQTKALDLLLTTLEPQTLDIPESTLNLLLPRPFQYRANRELIATHTSPTFDAIGAAQSAAKMTATFIFEPARCARVIDQHRRDPSLLSYENILSKVSRQVFEGYGGNARLREIRRAIQIAVMEVMLSQAANTNTPPSVRGQTELALHQLHTLLTNKRPDRFEEVAHRAACIATLQRFFNREMNFTPTAPAAPPPPGSPIGASIHRNGNANWNPHAAQQQQRSTILQTLPANLGECAWPF